MKWLLLVCVLALAIAKLSAGADALADLLNYLCDKTGLSKPHIPGASLIGREGVVTMHRDGTWYAKIDGIRWVVQPEGAVSLGIGNTVEVVSVEGTCLRVKVV